jgi:diaminopimelate decarboxylase
VLIERVDPAAIAAEVGTPFYGYSAAAIGEAYAAWRSAFDAVGFAGERHRTCYAVKANSALAVLRHLAAAGASFDVVSAGELHRVEAAGADTAGVVFSGPGKSAEDLQAAIAAGVGLVNLEAPDEADRLAALAEAAGRRVAVGIRLNPDLYPKTHPSIATGPRNTKFGLAPDEIETLLAGEAVRGPLEIQAVAVHIGSQITDLEPLESAARQALQWAHRLREAGHPVRWIDTGGGLGIRYTDEVGVPTAADLAARVGEALAGWDGGLITEPGRAIVAAAGWLFTRVISVRRRQPRGLLVCDAGMNALLRPALYGAVHGVLVVDRSEDGDPGDDRADAGEGRWMASSSISHSSASESMTTSLPVTRGDEARWDVVGPLCETGDVLARNVSLGGVGAGSLLAVRDAGAYGYVMASEYNAHPRPAQIWIDGDRWATITPRLTFDEMLGHERLAPWQETAPPAAG